MDEREWLDCFAVSLSLLMDDYGVSQTELAEAIGVTVATVNGYINRKRMPSLKAIINISYLFHVSIDDLVDYGGPIN